MSRNGAGTYNLPSGNPVVTNTTISSTWANSTLSDIASALTQSVAKDGQTVMTNNLPMGGFKLTNLGAGTNAGDSVRYQQLFSQGLPTDIASAATTDIGGQNTAFLNVTGTVGITSLGTNYNGPRILKFLDVLTITHDSTTLVLPNATNITTQAGDYAIFVPKSTVSGTPDGWALVNYLNSDGNVYVKDQAYDAATWDGNLSAPTKNAVRDKIESIASAIQGSFKGLTLSSSGTNSNVLVNCSQIVVRDNGFLYKSIYFISLTINLSISGINGLDTGTSSASTWYSVWIISDGTTTSGLLSLSSTNPTMPTGYTYKARVGWIRTDSTANKYPLSFTQNGNIVSYKIASGSNVTDWPTLTNNATGSLSAPTWTTVSLSNFIPSTALQVGVMVAAANNGAAIAVVPNNSYPAIGTVAGSVAGAASVYSASDNGGYTQRSSGMILLESINIYVATTATNNTVSKCYGWIDNI